MKKLWFINPKSKFAKECTKKYGNVWQVADERDGATRFVSAKEQDVIKFKNWSVWLNLDEYEAEKI